MTNPGPVGPGWGWVARPGPRPGGPRGPVSVLEAGLAGRGPQCSNIGPEAGPGKPGRDVLYSAPKMLYNRTTRPRRGAREKNRMANPVQTVIQHLSRAKAAFLKGETLRPLVSVAEALKIVVTTKLHSQDMAKIAGLLRENLQNLGRMEEVASRIPGPLAYQPGGERALLAQLVPVIKAIHADARREDTGAVRERKLKIDHAIIHGTNALQGGKVEEAQGYFREAVELYADEHAMFLIIADRLQAAGAFKESFEYLRGALGVNPDDRKACEMVVTASEQVANPDRGLTLLRKLSEKKGAGPHMHLALARLLALKKQWTQAEEHARAALLAREDLVDARKLLRRLEARAAKAAKAGPGLDSPVPSS